MTSESRFSLFVLPSELRTKVYEFLLCPNIDGKYILYHDRLGRKSSGVDPGILRVCRRIYDEAVNILYDRNIFVLELATPVVFRNAGGKYLDNFEDPPPLLHKEGQVGVITPSRLQRLRHIHLIISHSAIWGHSDHQHYFSHTGELILAILQHLIDDPAQTAVPNLNKTLKLTIGPHWLDHMIDSANDRTVPEILAFLDPPRGTTFNHPKDNMKEFIRGVGWKREVEIVEDTEPRDYFRWF